MSKIWDISPPRKKARLTPTIRRERRSNISWLFFLSLIAAFFIVFFGVSKFPQSNPNQPQATATLNNSTSLSSTSPEVKTQTNISLKLLNGTGRFEETDRVKKLLSDSGFKVSLTENALNIYDQTIVYYQGQYENYANNLAQVLKTYNPKIQKFTQSTQYDIVIVIGSK